MKKNILILLFMSIFISASKSQAKEYSILSPDGNLKVQIRFDKKTSFSVYYVNNVLVENTEIGLVLEDGTIIGERPSVTKKNEMVVDEYITSIVPTKSSRIHDYYRQVSFSLKGKSILTFRVYNEGIAYRFELNRKELVNIKNEILNIPLNENVLSFFPEEESMMSHYERYYIEENVGEIGKDRFCSLPVLFKTPDEINLLITEADLYDYPGMFLKKNATGFNAVFPNVVTSVKPNDADSPDRNEIIEEESDFIARTTGNRTFPWRVMMISDTDAGLVTNDMVFLLSRPLQLENPKWIRPGKVAWDWWNANNIYGVDFESGINNDTYRFYIDFAAEFNLDYIILDEGWSMTSTNIRENNPNINVEELVRYGDRKNVGIILWTLWKPLDRDMEEVLDLYKKWGVKGIKVDFMQRSDQYMVNFYERVAREAAKRALLVDFHGAFKPSGLRRAYPNVVSYEGVKGMEQLKWSDTNTPEHNLTLPFIRMAVGPMDYTPGAMQNAHPEHFMDRFTSPMSIGTRCHQVAMYVVYESPLQMLADSPSNYLKERTTTEFISEIPTTWDETIVLEAKIGDYILLARRKGENWYVAALNDENPRTLDLDLSFLPEGNYAAEIMRDGVNANKIAIDYKHLTETVRNKYTRKISLARGGGWVAILRPVK